MEGCARCCESQSGSRALVGVCMCVGGVSVCVCVGDVYVCVCLCVWVECECVQVCVQEECVYRCVCRRNTCGWVVAKVVGGVWQAEGEEGAGLQAGSLGKGRSRSLPEGGGRAEKGGGCRGRGPRVWLGPWGP